ncbi:hypothetical protein SLOPH_578 [Spraguea lophii 42_110]|uniref:Uncharacterized protein n=1 Tax=Spraguea lophii (strain 42_110) TaxID=1358809 RepID=S7XFV2_SPRLO|nr:hypothetical protein SLOPH_578 [Spraguea lophii 42_110]
MNVFMSLLFFICTLTFYNISQFKFFLPDYELQKLQNFFNRKIDELNIENKIVDNELTEYMYNMKKIIQYKHYFADVDIMDLLQNMRGIIFVKNLLDRVKDFNEEEIFTFNTLPYNLCMLLPIALPLIKILSIGYKYRRKIQENNK